MDKQRKIQLGLQLTELCKGSVGFFILGYQGMTVEETSALRHKLRPVGARARVIKNYVAQKALAPFSCDFSQQLKGQTLLVLVESDLVATAKVLMDFSKENEKLAIKGGYTDDHLLSPQEVKVYATLPSRDEIMAGLLRVIQGNATNTVRVIAAVSEKLVRTIKAIADAKAS